MQMGISSVEFSYNNTMYQQTDGVAMGFPLGPALANIFVGYQETKLFLNIKKPLIFYCYIDDTFVVFENEDDCKKFLSSLNFLYSLLCFTFKKELNSSLLFLDVLIEKHKMDLLHLCIENPPLPANTYTGILLAL